MISGILIGLIAALHVYILVLEMFLWETPRARRAFNLSADFASWPPIRASITASSQPG